ncbi:MAG: hypothetical protein CMJ46_00390 [Planctomyces sp.]|nr:hypothetical protein [Planctomyces sp.]
MLRPVLLGKGAPGLIACLKGDVQWSVKFPQLTIDSLEACLPTIDIDPVKIGSEPACHQIADPDQGGCDGDPFFACHVVLYRFRLF